MPSSQKKLAAHNARNLIGGHDTATKKAEREDREAGATIDPVDGVDLLDSDGARATKKAARVGGTGGVDSKHGSPELAPVQPRAPPCRMLRFVDVIECTGLSRTTIWRRVKAGTFPAPRSLGENSVGWPEHLITDWVESRPVVSWSSSSEANAA